MPNSGKRTLPGRQPVFKIGIVEQAETLNNFQGNLLGASDFDLAVHDGRGNVGICATQIVGAVYRANTPVVDQNEGIGGIQRPDLQKENHTQKQRGANYRAKQPALAANDRKNLFKIDCMQRCVLAFMRPAVIGCNG